MQQISILTILFTLLAISASWAQFAGGSGTEEDPYQIATLEQLQAVGDSVNLDKHFIQIADIDATETAGWHGGKGFDPIGSGNSFDNVFAGSFDGQGYLISNLSIIRNEENDVGLFGYVIGRAKIHNVHLDQIKVHGRDRVGGLVGSGEGLMVEQSGTSGQVIGNKFVGGLVGVSGAWINKSYSLSDVTGEENAGGLVGLVYDGGINVSFSTGNVKGSDVIGGLVGSGMFIHNSYATGDVTGNRQVGGLVGENLRTWTDDYVSIISSFATGAVTGDDFTGGLIGSWLANIIRSYWSSQASGRDDWIGSGRGVSMDKIKAKLYDQGRHGQVANSSTAGMFGPPIIDLEDLTTEQMTGKNAYIYMYKLDFEITWQLTEGYPVLAWQEPEDAVDPPQVPIIRIDTTKRDFGVVSTDKFKTLEVPIRNTGNNMLNGEVYLAGPDAGLFIIADGLSSFSLEVDSSQVLAVSFQPEGLESYEGELHVVHDAPNRSDTLIIPLRGEGKEPTDAVPDSDLPGKLTLHQNYPNPFNPVTVIEYVLPESVDVTLQVYDVMGRMVETLVDELKTSGKHQATWDASDAASGTYIYRLQAGDVVISRKLMLVK